MIAWKMLSLFSKLCASPALNFLHFLMEVPTIMQLNSAKLSLAASSVSMTELVPCPQSATRGWRSPASGGPSSGTTSSAARMS